MPNQEWEIIYYKTSQGRWPVLEFINSLEAVAKSKIIDTFDLLTEFGINLGALMSKSFPALICGNYESLEAIVSEYSMLPFQEKNFFFYMVFKRKRKKQK